MNIVRYSAVEQFGIPLYDPNILEKGNESELMRLLGQYAIEPVEVPVCEAVDITPYYLRKKTLAFQYISRLTPDGPVTVEHMLTQSGTISARVQRETDQSFTISPTSQQTIIPTDARYFAWIVLHGPRFPDKPTLHELIIPEFLGQNGR